MELRIDGVELTPNPVNTGGSFIIKVLVTEILQGISTDDGCYIATSDGAAIVSSGTTGGK